MSKDETQKIASATALALVALLEEKGVLRNTAKGVIEKTEQALRQYPVWRTMNDPDAQRKVAEIDACLEAAANDPYVDTIRRFYFDGLTNAATAKMVCCDARTAQRNRRELVKQFAARLYPKEYMQEML